ncbi:hypothetical protein SXCC_01722 [Gluconacetobacter sp. SXCC-1]|nr:hypothetical protein SXCC_01722 [Gluconacetobacter sp. SXCC-1]
MGATLSTDRAMAPDTYEKGAHPCRDAPLFLGQPAQHGKKFVGAIFFQKSSIS